MWSWKKKRIPKFRLIHLQHNTEKRVKLKRTPRWERTNDEQGHKPKFKIRCFHCRLPMSLRHSVIIDPKMATANEEDTDLNVMSYKCPRCAWFIRFNVLDSNWYLKKVVKKYRKGYRKFIPTVDDLSEESPAIREQLAKFGYWAGRIDSESIVTNKEGRIIGHKIIKKHVEGDGEGGLTVKELGEEIKYLVDKEI